MPRFDIHPADDGTFLLDCQSDLLSDLNSRFVVPLQPVGRIRGGDRRLNPIFAIQGSEYVMQTHFAAAVSTKILNPPIASLIEHEYTIGGAIDMLTGSY